MKEKFEAISGERPIDIDIRSQRIYAAPAEVEHDLKVEWLVVQQKVVLSQIGVLEEDAKKALIERERWNTRFNAMFDELRSLYKRHNKLAEEIKQTLTEPVAVSKAK